MERLYEEALFELRNKLGALKGRAKALGDAYLAEWCETRINEIKKVLTHGGVE
jgi:hypothetical protein